ncbi:hypothetical protein DW081_14755 [Clostridium sp. AF46-9NS]|nr:hypothetical protein DW081_14755 [Clostridium sp. AF46-9NS]
MKNKMICTLLTTVMVLSFAACGSQGNGAASAESTVTSEIGAEASTAESSAAELVLRQLQKLLLMRPTVLLTRITLQFPQRMLPLSLKRSRMP